MESITKYRCDYCGMEYNTTEECATCEASHKKFVGLVSQQFDRTGDVPPKYPSWITVELEDNHYAQYKFQKPILANEINNSPIDDNNDDNTDDEIPF